MDHGGGGGAELGWAIDGCCCGGGARVGGTRLVSVGIVDELGSGAIMFTS